MPTAQVGDIELGYDVHGKGPPLLFVMGFTASRFHWQGFHERFADRYRVITFDNRGVGASRAAGPPTSTRQMASDALGLLDALDIPRAHVFGVSMGGMIAQAMALAAPARVDRLVLGCTHFGGPNQTVADADVIAAFGRVGTQSAETTIRELLALNFTPRFWSARPELMDDLVRFGLGSRVSAATFAGQARAIIEHDTESSLGDITAPTLVIAGAADRLIPSDNSRKIAARLPNATLSILPDVAHMFWIEASDMSERTLRAHLEGRKEPLHRG